MPYIKAEDRAKYEKMFRTLYDSGKISNPGELNYIFTIIINHYLIGNGLNYQHINDAIGALEGCKLELYRRTVANYEQLKMEENGDV